MNSKQELYNKLVEEFKNYNNFPEGLINPHSNNFFKSKNESKNVINPWELWHGHIDQPKIMLIGQDFSHVESFENTFRYGWNPDATDQVLQDLFKLAIPEDIGLPTKKEKLPLFFTNAVLGIKRKSKSEKISNVSWYKGTSYFLKQTIEIIQPKNIIVMGQIAYKTICHIYNTQPVKGFENAIELNGKGRPSNIFAVSHCSPLGLSNRKLKLQEQDWKKLRKLLIMD